MLILLPSSCSCIPNIIALPLLDYKRLRICIQVLITFLRAFHLLTMLSFLHPTTILISGPTQCGKTYFFKQILAHKLIQPPPSRIIYVNSERPAELSEFPNIEFIQGISKLVETYETIDPKERNLIVIDDQMGEAGSHPLIGSLFTKNSHHKNITVIYIVQNLFDKGRHHRTISLNSHYLVLFKNPRDQGQVRALAQQVFPTNVKYLLDAFQDATRSKYGYLFLDCHPHTPTELRVRGNIFQNDEIDIYLQGEAEIPPVEKVFQLGDEGYINPGEKPEKDAHFSTD